MITKAIISDGDKYLIAEIGAGAYTGLWDFIGTFLPEDKTPEDFLKEFVEANLGLKIKVGEILARYDAESSHSYDTVFYLCELVDGTVNIACLGYRVAEWVKKEDFKSYSFESRNHVAIEALLNIEQSIDRSGQKVVSDGELVSITLMIDESDPKEKDIMTTMVMNLLTV